MSKKMERRIAAGEQSALPKLFICFVLFWGILYSLVWIPFSAPDEYAHFATAYRVSDLLLHQHRHH